MGKTALASRGCENLWKEADEIRAVVRIMFKRLKVCVCVHRGLEGNYNVCVRERKRERERERERETEREKSGRNGGREKSCAV